MTLVRGRGKANSSTVNRSIKRDSAKSLSAAATAAGCWCPEPLLVGAVVEDAAAATLLSPSSRRWNWRSVSSGSARWHGTVDTRFLPILSWRRCTTLSEEFQLSTLSTFSFSTLTTSTLVRLTESSKSGNFRNKILKIQFWVFILDCSNELSQNG